MSNHLMKTDLIKFKPNIYTYFIHFIFCLKRSLIQQEDLIRRRYIILNNEKTTTKEIACIKTCNVRI